MHMKKALLLLPVALAVLLFTEGCAKKSGETVDVSELGFSMTLPKGWKVDSRGPYFFYSKGNKHNTFGEITTIPSNGSTLMSFVDKQVEAAMKTAQIEERSLSGTTGVPKIEIVSRTHRGINGMNSVELVTRSEGYHVFTVWMAKGQEIIKVSFQVPDDKFSEQRDSLVKTAKSITFK